MERLPGLDLLSIARLARRAGAALAPAVLLYAGVAPGLLPAQTITQDEALSLAFPGAEVERRTAYLNRAQLDSARVLAGTEADLESAVVTYYVATRAGAPAGVAYFDAARVRTLPQVLMIVVDASNHIARIETLSFLEPPEYRAPKSWLELFDGKPLEEVTAKGDIPNMTGATLTSRAVTAAARRALALHRVIDPMGDGHR